jgi:dTDP-4-amino-4,6-dideoxygalactose transaminase
MKKCFAYLLTVAFLVLVGLSPVMADTQPQYVASTRSLPTLALSSQTKLVTPLFTRPQTNIVK